MRACVPCVAFMGHGASRRADLVLTTMATSPKYAQTTANAMPEGGHAETASGVCRRRRILTHKVPAMALARRDLAIN